MYFPGWQHGTGMCHYLSMNRKDKLQKYKLFFFYTVCIGLLLSPIISRAEKVFIPYKKSAVEIRLNTGYMTGRSTEEIYDVDGSGSQGRKLSQLNWNIDHIKLYGIGASLIPVRRMWLHIDYFNNLSHSSGTMEDFDWLYPGSDWSNYSFHRDTTVTNVDGIDINGEFLIKEYLPNRKAKISFSALIGYRRDRFSWRASGGLGIYSVNSFRDTPYIFKNKVVVSYQQKYTVPYIGLNIRAWKEVFETNLKIGIKVRYSNLVHGEDIDTHYLSNVRFEDKASGGTWRSYDVNTSLELSRRFSVNLGYVADIYSVGDASTKIINLSTGKATLYSGPYAALSHHSNKLYLGITYLY